MKYLLLSFIALLCVPVSKAQNYYDVKGFTGVATSETISSQITLTDKFSVELKGNQEAIDELVVELRKNTLVIRPRINWRSWQRTYPDAQVVAYITMPKINVLIASGSGRIDVKGTNQTENLVITVSGAAKINLQNKSKSTTVVMSGSGDCTLEGNSEALNITLSGSGIFKGEAYKVKDLTAFMSGSGQIYTYTQNLIKATMAGSGSVFYKGDPDVKTTQIMGTGKVIPMEN